MKINTAELSNAIFGAFDGMTSVWGVITALLVKSGSNHSIVLASVGLAIASAVGMGAGEWLGDDKGNIPNAIAMLLATLSGTLAPVLPFLVFGRTTALIVSVLVTLSLCAIIAYERHKGFIGYVQTYGVLLVAGVLTAIFSLIS